METNTSEQYSITVSSIVEDPIILAQSHMMYKIGAAINLVYFPVLIPLAVVGNTLSFLVMIQSHNRHTSFSVYIAALAVSDTIGVLVALPIYLNQVHELNLPPSQLGYCAIHLYFTVSSFISSCYLLIAMTFERFYGIIQPHKASLLNTVKRAKITIASIFVFSFSFAVPYLFVVGTNGRLCIANRFASNNVLGEFYSWSTDILFFIIPFPSLLVMNSVIIYTLRKRSMLNFSESIGQIQTEPKTLKLKNSEKQVLTMVLLITFAFLILNMPARALTYYLNFYSGDTPYFQAGLYLFYQVGEKCHYTNHGINFFLYVLSGQKFRTDLKNLFRFKKSSHNDIFTSNVSSMTTSVADD